MSPEFALELQNGDWGIASLALAVLCGFYLSHEIIARKSWRSLRATQGMRNAIALLMLSAGVFIRSAEIFRWRSGGGDLRDLSQTWLQIGGIIAVLGFLCTIREISKPLYGDAPWLWTLGTMVLFTITRVGIRLF